MRRVAAIVSGLFALVAVVAAPARAAQDATTPPAGAEAEGLAGVLSAEFDAFAVRVEYDIPLPAGPGTVPHVVGEVRRSGAGENAKGLAAAPTHFDAVVAGTYYDPKKDQKGDENQLPQVECFYPGDLVNTRFSYPTDTRAETKPLPATAFSTAQCGAGPSVALQSAGTSGDLPSVAVRDGSAEADARPVERRLGSSAAARASGVSIAGGAITVGSVQVDGASSVTGAPGEGRTEAHVTLNDVVAGGVRFSLVNDRIVVAGQELPLQSEQVATLVKTINTTLAAQGVGCTLDATTQPDRYPQGYLLARKPPAIGLSADGTLASSMRTGLSVVCDLPKDLTEPTTFSPQRMQVELGFVYTGAFAGAEPTGFSLGSLGAFTGDDGSGSDDGSAFSTPLDLTPSAVAGSDLGVPDVAPSTDAGAAPADAGASAAPTDTKAAAPTQLVRRFSNVAVELVPLGAGTRVALGLAALLAWALLTHLGLRRLRGVTRP